MNKEKMKKIIILVSILIFCVAALGIASNAPRQISSGRLTSATSLRDGPGEIYSITIRTTSAGGSVIVYDSSLSTTGTILIDLQQATQFNSMVKDFPEGLKAYKGIYVVPSQASTVIYYY